MAETINGLYKAEVIYRRGPWRSFEAVEYATLEWVDWFNHRRLLEPIGNIRLPKPKINTMLPQTTSIWQRDSQPTASGKPGAVHTLDDDDIVSSGELVAPRTRFRRLAKMTGCRTLPIMPPA